MARIQEEAESGGAKAEATGRREGLCDGRALRPDGNVLCQLPACDTRA